jgi:ribokinase
VSTRDSRRLAVVGHVEWVEFARVEHVPAPGEIVHAAHTWDEPAGGGPVAAVQLAKLAGASKLFTALGDDELGRRVPEELARHGVQVHAVFRDTPQRRAFTFLDGEGERTITVIGERLGPNGDDPLPWDELDSTDAVYFTAGDDGALRAARRSGRVVATARVFDHLVRTGVPLDAVVASAKDANEPYEPGRLKPPPGMVVLTAGADGGTFQLADGTRGRFAPAPPPGPVVDAYGCGDSFAAGLTYGLGAGMGPEEALALAARCGAACLTGRGPYEGQLRLT